MDEHNPFSHFQGHDLDLCNTNSCTVASVVLLVLHCLCCIEYNSLRFLFTPRFYASEHPIFFFPLFTQKTQIRVSPFTIVPSDEPLPAVSEQQSPPPVDYGFVSGSKPP
ncbi:hypothetical protein L1987_81408 [Smallanthus sonchifolius]|uniref:Uncharacterized protein n=1 Tax=Smallanthus sonchifolius TaxID=185202 RepID=A0ACB8YR43_9ASTR|nr:hypothetical protein L1987_81408 [Smallanthus sonchifolius]